MHIVCATFRVDPLKWDAFLPLMLTNARASGAGEPGCHQFDVCVDAGLCEVFLYEVYDDAAAFTAHLGSPHFEAFDRAVKTMILTKDVHQYTRITERSDG